LLLLLPFHSHPKISHFFSFPSCEPLFSVLAESLFLPFIPCPLLLVVFLPKTSHSRPLSTSPSPVVYSPYPPHFFLFFPPPQHGDTFSYGLFLFFTGLRHGGEPWRAARFFSVVFFFFFRVRYTVGLRHSFLPSASSFPLPSITSMVSGALWVLAPPSFPQSLNWQSVDRGSDRDAFSVLFFRFSADVTTPHHRRVLYYSPLPFPFALHYEP